MWLSDIREFHFRLGRDAKAIRAVGSTAHFSDDEFGITSFSR
jgi:hypothetical protein